MSERPRRLGVREGIRRMTPARVRWQLLGLVVALAGTWALGQWHQERAGVIPADAVDGARQEAFLAIEEAAHAEYASMMTRAREWARDPDVVAGLRLQQLGQEGGRRRLVAWAASIDRRDREFVEIYDPTPALQAWSGAAFPMDAAVRSDLFLRQELEGLATDRQTRTAFTVWVPVLDGNTILGVVRLGRVVEERMPVRNEYLRDMTWDEEWTRKLGQSVTFAFGTAEDHPAARSALLRSPSGVPLATVDIDDPDLARRISMIGERYRDALLLWILVAMLLTGARFSLFLWRSVPGTPPSGALIALYGVFLVSIRQGLLWMDIPARWQGGKAPFSPLFDPQHLASAVGFGAMRTIGDLLVSSVFLMVFVAVFLRVTLPVRQRVYAALHFASGRFTPGIWLFLGMQQLLIWGGAFLLYEVAHHAVLDATLDYFERSGLVPGRLVLVVFAALLLATFAVVLLLARLSWVLAERFALTKADLPSPGPMLGAIGTVLLPVLLVEGMLTTDSGVPIVVLLMITAATWLAALIGPTQPIRQSPIVALRRIVPIIILTSIVLYPMMEIASEDKARLRMEQAAVSFLADRDARALFAITEVLEASEEPDFIRSLREPGYHEGEDTAIGQRSRLDSLSGSLATGFMAGALSRYDVTVALFSDQGRLQGRHSTVPRRVPRATADAEEETEFELFEAMYREIGATGNMVEKLTGSADQNRFRYAGFRRLETGGFLLVRAEQRALTGADRTPFPRVLVPVGYYGDRYADLSIAEFTGGVLSRTEGEHRGRSLLDGAIVEVLQRQPDLWRRESIRDRTYLTYYRVRPDASLDDAQQVTAVRRSVPNIFDRLYHLLRIIVAGLLLCTPIYIVGIFRRLRRKSPQPAARHFRDRVLNAFFSVGIITVVAMGLVGLRVVTGESERAVESWLRQHLDRVEESLELEVQGEELPYQVMDRISVDSLAARMGVDLVVYDNLEVEQASRPELIRDRLIEPRLPIEAYEALYFDGFRFVTVDERLGTFAYTAGYRALTDEQGLPRYVVSIPSLPEQERIEEERARTVAYLFGALLLLVLVVMITASLLANALTRPIARLRTGLQSVAAGHFERMPPVESGDEIAELVDSFNTMQDQLKESRELLAQQERQLAWREMARQVAHEIKNPLTPMKLSIQHLRSAFDRRATDGSDEERFAGKFGRTTTTLIEQIDTLARIANEFSSFGRMPTQIKEEMDLNTVIEEAVDLMRAEQHVAITSQWAAGPLWIMGDREALRRVYVNFLKNGIQAVPEDRPVRIHVETATEADDAGRLWAVGRVTDNGSGIPRHLWEKIFVPSFSTKTSGTGLGLAIAKKAIENMDGDIGFETTSGKGTTFWIRIPLSVEILDQERAD